MRMYRYERPSVLEQSPAQDRVFQAVGFLVGAVDVDDIEGLQRQRAQLELGEPFENRGLRCEPRQVQIREKNIPDAFRIDFVRTRRGRSLQEGVDASEMCQDIVQH